MPEPHGVKRTWLWWSSGKDSAWALHVLRQDPEVRVEALVTTVAPDDGPVPVHGTSRSVLREQARLAGLPLREVELPAARVGNTAYEATLEGVFAAAREAGVTRMAYGDLYLADIRAYREGILAGTGLEALFPLWGRDTAELAREMIAGGLEAVVTAVDPEKLGEAFVGRCFDAGLLAALPAGVDPCGENGEFHTCVVAGPDFDGRLSLAPDGGRQGGAEGDPAAGPSSPAPPG
jgi:uncharacterized protein (TIGR00290 family)